MEESKYDLRVFLNEPGEALNVSSFLPGSPYSKHVLSMIEPYLRRAQFKIDGTNTLDNSQANTSYTILMLEPYANRLFRVWIRITNSVESPFTQYDHVVSRFHDVVNKSELFPMISDIFVKSYGIYFGKSNTVKCENTTDILLYNIHWPSLPEESNVTIMCPNETSDVSRFVIRYCNRFGWSDIDDLRCTTSRSTRQNSIEIRRMLIEQLLKHELCSVEKESSISDMTINQTLHRVSPYFTSAYTFNSIDSNMTADYLTMLNVIASNLPLTLEKDMLRSIRDMVNSVAKYMYLDTGDFVFDGKQISMFIPHKSTIETVDDFRLLVSLADAKNIGIQLLKDATLMHHNLRLDFPNKTVIQKRIATSTILKTNKIAFYVFSNGRLFGNSFQSLPVYSLVFTDDMLGEKVINITYRFPRLLYNRVGPQDGQCAYWGPNVTEIHQGRWSGNGCSLHFVDEDVECHCNGVNGLSYSFVSKDAIYSMARHEQISSHFNPAIVIGCTVSSLFLLITIVTYVIFPKLRTEMLSQTLLVLCGHLLATNILYMSNILFVHAYQNYLDGSNSVENWLCKGFVVTLHFFLLSTLVWMVMENFCLYKSMISMFDLVYVENMLLKMVSRGTGFPVCVSILTALVTLLDKHQYGVVGHKLCWLKSSAMAIGFVTPGVLLALFNVYLILVFATVFCDFIKKENHCNNDPFVLDIMRQFKCIMCMFTLMFFTWSFALAAANNASVIFDYLFLACNSSLGLFILLVHVVLCDTARDQWASLCRRMSGATDTNLDMFEFTLDTTDGVVQKGANAISSSVSANGGIAKPTNSQPSPKNRKKISTTIM